MSEQTRIEGFAPVYREDAKILICGSMPSIESLKQDFYYGHPRNAFWRIIAEVFHEVMPGSIREKKEILIRNRIALWDTVRTCERKGSLDSAIKNPVPNDFDGLYIHCPGIRHILFNGKASAQLYARLVARTDPMRTFHVMPSTSPAYTMSFAAKKEIWENTLKEVLK